jgi:hypothetical protein
MRKPREISFNAYLMEVPPFDVDQEQHDIKIIVILDNVSQTPGQKA